MLMLVKHNKEETIFLIMGLANFYKTIRKNTSHNQEIIRFSDFTNFLYEVAISYKHRKFLTSNQDSLFLKEIHLKLKKTIKLLAFFITHLSSYQKSVPID
jgi:hypothetical protein